MLMRCTEGVETDYDDSSAFSPVGGILGYYLAERAWSLEDHPETSETDHHPVTILGSARDEFAPFHGCVGLNSPHFDASLSNRRPSLESRLARENDNDFTKQ